MRPKSKESKKLRDGELVELSVLDNYLCLRHRRQDTLMSERKYKLDDKADEYEVCFKLKKVRRNKERNTKLLRESRKSKEGGAGWVEQENIVT